MDITNTQACVFFGSFLKFTPRHFNKLYSIYGSAKDIIKNFNDDCVKKLLDNVLYNEISHCLNHEYLNNILNTLKSKNINVITYFDENFPICLKQFDDSPFLLYTLGDISLLKSPMITVVGSRNCTAYGVEQTEKITKGLCGYGFTIVSGLARGIDTAANSTALKYGKTIAVIAGGFDRVYPSCNKALFEKIALKGLVISQYMPAVTPKPYMFPYRNRIMAALSKGVVITEAGKRSGALITADCALNMGKSLYVLPSNVNSIRGQGSNNLLKQMQGAMICCYEDILIDMGIDVKKEPEEKLSCKDKEEQKILKLLQYQNEHIEDIALKTGMSINRAGALLTIMEIKGLVKKLSNNRFGI